MERAQFERAKRDELRPRHRFFRKLTAITICFVLVCMLVPVAHKKAKANPAVAAPLLVAACSAAGITVEEFALGMTAIITATTGVALMGTMADYEANIEIPVGLRHWKTPGWRDWEDMTTDEQLATGCLNNYQYYLRWLQYYCLYYGLFNEGNGNPDPDDPQGPKFDSSLVTMVKTLGIATGGVALANYRYPVNKGSYLFSNDGLGLLYQQTASVLGTPVQMAIYDQTYPPTDFWYAMSPQTQYQYYTVFHTIYNNSQYQAGTITLTKDIQGNWRTGDITTRRDLYRNGSMQDWQIVNNDHVYIGPDNGNSFLNAIYRGTYVFQSGQDTVTYTENKFQSDDSSNYSQSIEYGQEPDTPLGLEQSVPYTPYLNNYLQNVDDGLPEGQSTYIVLPDLSHTNEVNYQDFVEVKNDDQTTTDPENPVQPNPDDDITEKPTEEDFADRFSRIIAQPFEAAFPFCLIEDARQLFLKLEAAAPEPDFTVILPLSDFEVDGADEIELDASFLINLGAAVKVGFNILWTAALIAFAYKLFLKRGE